MIKFTHKATSSVDEVMKKSVISDGFERLNSVPLNHQSIKQLRQQRRKERVKTKGSDWFNFPATKKTEEIKKDLEVLQMRSALDPKRFYKKNDLKTLPKYFQIGKIADNPEDYYSSRLTKKERKRTLVEELLVDEDFKHYTKRKYQEIVTSNPKRKRKAAKQAKKLKRLKR